jgi:hypothetical protein
MTRALADSLTAIEARLGGLDRRVVSFLQPGLSKEDTSARLGMRGLSIETDLLNLYEWRNGTDAPKSTILGDLAFIPGFYLLSLEDALANFDAFGADPRWQQAWFPLLADGGGDFLTIDLTAGSDFGAVRHFRIEQEEHPLEYRSLRAMFATFASAYERGIFRVDADGFLEVDDGEYAILAAELNPEVAWWRD